MHLITSYLCRYKLFIIREICVVQCGLSDHFPVCVSLGFVKVNSGPKDHHEIRFRNVNNFDLKAFIFI